jgi:hypothetical protein
MNSEVIKVKMLKTIDLNKIYGEGKMKFML